MELADFQRITKGNTTYVDRFYDGAELHHSYPIIPVAKPFDEYDELTGQLAEYIRQEGLPSDIPGIEIGAKRFYENSFTDTYDEPTEKIRSFMWNIGTTLHASFVYAMREAGMEYRMELEPRVVSLRIEEPGTTMETMHTDALEDKATRIRNDNGEVDFEIHEVYTNPARGRLITVTCLGDDTQNAGTMYLDGNFVAPNVKQVPLPITLRNIFTHEPETTLVTRTMGGRIIRTARDMIPNPGDSALNLTANPHTNNTHLPLRVFPESMIGFIPQLCVHGGQSIRPGSPAVARLVAVTELDPIKFF